DKTRAVVSAIEDARGRALAVQADMSQIGDVRRLFQETLDHFGRLDILVNNAGLFQPHSIAEVTEDEFDAAFALNAKGAFFAFQEAARPMSRRIPSGERWGHRCPLWAALDRRRTLRMSSRF